MSGSDGRPKRGAIVLCGGKSTRMGRDKASLPFGDEALLQRIVRIVSSVVDDVVVVAAPGQELPALPDGVTVTRDEIEGKGPVGGLVPGLRATSAGAVYATGCDVPFLVPAFVEMLFDRLDDHDVAVATTDGFVHPLAAVYRTTVLPHAENQLREGRLRPIFLYDVVDTVRVDENALRAADPELASLDNLNTPEAYETALAKLQETA